MSDLLSGSRTDQIHLICRSISADVVITPLELSS